MEDEPEVNELLEVYLRDEFDLLTALSGESAIERLDESIDVVILDRRLPGISGDEVGKEIRNRGLDIQIIMVTAVDKSEHSGFTDYDDYLEKPIGKDELISSINHVLQS